MYDTSPAELSPAPQSGARHDDLFSSVYVNAIGHPTYISEKVARFPEGSVIVREKLTRQNSSTPELLAVMVKRDQGFNSASGDWEYLVLNGAGTEVRGRGNLLSCNSCHAQRKESDFVFRADPPQPSRLKER